MFFLVYTLCIYIYMIYIYIYFLCVCLLRLQAKAKGGLGKRLVFLVQAAILKSIRLLRLRNLESIGTGQNVLSFRCILWRIRDPNRTAPRHGSTIFKSSRDLIQDSATLESQNPE